ncbi:MAG TPA: winged helix-turn-helix domain-containing protein [Bryobacteraceae bacterium]|nr:winged helix-turn-helix domain-containing protein [Bryobacteraceae bacterium]
MTNPCASCFEFDDFRVEPRNYKVVKAGSALPLEPKTFQLLVFLLENRDRLVEKGELLDAIWKDIAVTENALTREVGKLRKSLGDDPKAAKYIQTVHTRGYRFIGNVRILTGAPEPAPAAGEEEESGRFEVAAGILIPPESEADATGINGTGPKRFSKWLPYKFFVALSALGLLVASTVLLRRPAAGTKAPAAKHAPTTLAVLPFRSLDGGPDDRYVGLGIADALITKLSNSAQLAVAPVSTILHYVDPTRDSLSIGRAMNVDYVLEGKFQRLADHMRVTLQLLCISCDGASRWAASFDETSKDLFQVQDSISQKVTAALPLELSRDEQMRVAKRETSEPEAQLAFAKGKLLLDDDTRPSLENAIDQFQFAVTRDPGYALAWTLLADAWRRRELYGASPADFLPKTREAIAKARQLDDNQAYTHSVLGLIAFQYDWDFATADREYRRARQLQPFWVHQWYARYLLAANRATDAEAEYRRFMRMVPFSAWGTTNFAQFLFLTAQYPRAIEQIRKTLDMQPDYAPAHELLGLVYEQQGQADQAVQEFQKASDLSHGYSGLAALGHLYAAAGKRAEARRVLGELDAQRRQRYVAPFELAVIHAGMGDKIAALDDLEKAYAERSLSAQSLRFDPRLSKVRAEPRYREFAKRLGLN